MTLIKARSNNYTNPALKYFCFFILSILISACDKAGPLTIQDDMALVREMKVWFEATDYLSSGYSSLEQGLEAIYQDDGYTVSLYRELKMLLNNPGTSRSAYDGILITCQEWFELIDYKRSGYSSLERAIKDIYQDGGETLDLYKRLARRNAGRDV
jgi:hypothetical protein